MKKIFSLTIAMIMAFIISGCSSNNQKSAENVEMPIVNIAIPSEANAQLLDATSYDAEMALYGAVYEPLVEYGEQGQYQPGLAESWEISEDGRTYTFHLKENVKFSDGSDVNAEAVKYTIERAKALNETTTLQTLLNLENIEAVDETTVTMHFTAVSNQVLAELSQTRPLRIMSPNSVVDGTVDGKFEEAIGSGAFTITDITSEQVTLSPNPYYNNEEPVNYQVVFKTIVDGSSRALALRSGEIDIAGGTLGSITDTDINSFKTDDAYKTYEFDGTMSHFLAFNPDNQVLRAPVRRGIELAIDKSKLSDKEITGLFRENVQYVTEDNQTVVSYNPEEAQKLFESEGFSKNADGYYAKDNEVLEFDLVIQTAEFPEWKGQAEVIGSDLKNVGVKANINILDSESYYDVLWNTKEYDMILYRTYTDALLPYNFLNSLYHSTAEEHAVFTDDTELTELLDEYAETISEDEQQEIFNSIFQRISDETLAIPIDYKDEKFVTSSKISEFNYSGLSDAPIDFKNLVVK